MFPNRFGGLSSISEEYFSVYPLLPLEKILFFANFFIVEICEKFSFCFSRKIFNEISIFIIQSNFSCQFFTSLQRKLHLSSVLRLIYLLFSLGALIFLSKLQLKHFRFSVEFKLEQLSHVY